MAIGTPVNLGGNNVGGASCTITTSVGATAGDVIIVAIRQAAAGALPTITDSAGNSYVIDFSASNDGTAEGVIGRSPNVLGLPSGGTITAASSGGSAMRAAAISISNVAPSPVDGTGFETDASTTGTATATMGVAGDILIGVVASSGNETVSSESPGFTALTGRSNVGGSILWAFDNTVSSGVQTYAPVISGSASKVRLLIGYEEAVKQETTFSLFRKQVPAWT